MCTEKTPWEEVIDFHGHTCPGIALGFRIASIAKAKMGIPPTINSELLVKAYTHSCALDAFQVINHATIGRGTLMIEEKQQLVYEFHFSGTNELLQITVSQAVKELLESISVSGEDVSAGQKHGKTTEAAKLILNLSENDLCSVETVSCTIKNTH